MKKVVLTIVISCVLIVALLLAFAKFIVNAPQDSNPNTSASSQVTGTTSIPSTTVPIVTTAPPSTGAPQNSAPAPSETSPNKTESKPQDSVTQTSIPAQNNTSSAERAELPAWKKSYANYVTVIQNYHQYDHFALVYLDDDDIPELYMYGNGKAKICTVDGNSGYGIDLDGYGGGNYCEKSGNFMNITKVDNFLVMRIYRLENNTFYETFCGMEDKTTNSPTYYVGDPSEFVEVSEETMKATVAQYIDTSNLKFLHENALTYEDFIKLMTT